MTDPFNVGHQTTDISSIGFGTDRPGICWLCLTTPMADPLATCDSCREELAA